MVLQTFSDTSRPAKQQQQQQQSLLGRKLAIDLQCGVTGDCQTFYGVILLASLLATQQQHPGLTAQTGKLVNVGELKASHMDFR